MGVRKYKPTSPGRRFMTVSDFEEVTKTKPEKSLLAPISKTGGRNNNGRITTRHIGGGHKRRYRIIDFKRRKDGVPAKVHSIEYDPNRSARIALLHYADGEKRYILAPLRLTVGDTVESGAERRHQAGQRAAAGDDPDRHDRAQHRAAARPGRQDGALRGRLGAADGEGGRHGAAAPALRRDAPRPGRLPRDVGQIGNVTHENVSGGKAGRIRWKGKRPTVRGTVMNPVDHPHGGGEGKNKGSHPVTPWGKPTLGYRTRNKKKASTSDIVRGRAREGRAVADEPVEQEGAVRGPQADEARRGDERDQPEADAAHLVALLHDLPRDGRAHDRGARRPQARARVRVGAMVGHKLGEFAPTRTYRGHGNDRTTS